MSSRPWRPSQTGTVGEEQQRLPRPQSSSQSAAPLQRVTRPPVALRSRPRRRPRPRQHRLEALAQSWLIEETTVDEAEEHFVRSLETDLPELFALSGDSRAVPAGESGGAPRLLPDTHRHRDLFGTWTSDGTYQEGRLVTSLRRRENLLDAAAARAVTASRQFLLEAIVARRERLSLATTVARRRRRAVSEVRAMEMTLQYISNLPDRLARGAAAPASD